ncbi:hypothetical protein LIER_24230 [Lithospermum erythrorhizon]|uniref:CCHC-type domain-containing protein n=1 Tax=Lithospermum erythrorhizon TaxID=34254 RepID=A0AAV3R2K5_LITER
MVDVVGKGRGEVEVVGKGGGGGKRIEVVGKVVAAAAVDDGGGGEEGEEERVEIKKGIFIFLGKGCDIRIILNGPLIPMKIRTIQAGVVTGDLSDDEMKKALEAGTNTIEVPITDADKTNLSEIRPDELKEEVIAYKKERRKNKKSLALVAAKAKKLLELDESDEDTDDLAMLTKKFKKILKYRNHKKEYPQRSRNENYERRGKSKDYGSYKNDQPKCFECNKPGHIKADCPRLKKKSEPKKGMKATWDDELTDESSDCEVEEITNVVCLMENDSTKVHSESDSGSSFCFDYDTDADSEYDDQKISYAKLSKINERILEDMTYMISKYKEDAPYIERTLAVLVRF